MDGKLQGFILDLYLKIPNIFYTHIHHPHQKKKKKSMTELKIETLLVYILFLNSCPFFLNSCMCVCMSVGAHTRHGRHRRGCQRTVLVLSFCLDWHRISSHFPMEYTGLASSRAFRESYVSASHLTVGVLGLQTCGTWYKPETYMGSGGLYSGHACMAIAEASAQPKVNSKAAVLLEDKKILVDGMAFRSHLPKLQLQGILHPLLDTLHCVSVCTYVQANLHTQMKTK